MINELFYKKEMLFINVFSVCFESDRVREKGSRFYESPFKSKKALKVWYKEMRAGFRRLSCVLQCKQI